MYIKKFHQLNEELKRKLSPTKLKQQIEDDEREKAEKLPLDFFSPDEIKILNSEDFDIQNQKEAKLIDNHLIYVIKKSIVDNEVLFTLTITDNETDEVIYDRKIKVNKRSLHKDTLDFMIDKCAYIEHNIKRNLKKGIDPYDEENWDDEEDSMKPDYKDISKTLKYHWDDLFGPTDAHFPSKSGQKSYKQHASDQHIKQPKIKPFKSENDDEDYDKQYLSKSEIEQVLKTKKRLSADQEKFLNRYFPKEMSGDDDSREKFLSGMFPTRKLSDMLPNGGGEKKPKKRGT